MPQATLSRSQLRAAIGLVVAVLGLAGVAACGGGSGDAAEGDVAPPRALQEAPIATGGDSAGAPSETDLVAADSSACPMAGLWRRCSVLERLERSGFVVLPMSDSVSQPGLGIVGSAFRLGSAELQLYLYADSIDARRQEAALDAAGARPTDASGVLRAPAVIRSNNLLALLFNNNDRQLERVQLAITAGLPAR